MIRLSSKHTMVLDPQGTARTFDLDAVFTDLRRCFRDCGVNEPWIADHIAMVVEEQLGTAADRRTTMMQEKDVHAMVMSLLAASGYEDVAAYYRERRSLPVPSPHARDMKAWDKTRVNDTLLRLLPLHEQERQNLANQVTGALEQLGFSSVSTDLIEQLALHAVASGSNRDHTPDNGQRKAWLLDADAWPVERCSDSTRKHMTRGILTAYPVSRVLPRVRLQLDLIAGAQEAGNPPLTELALLPAVNRCAAAAAELLHKAVRQLADLHPDGPPMPPHLLVIGIDTVVDDLVVPQSARSRKQLRHDLLTAIQSRLEQDCGDDILITLR